MTLEELRRHGLGVATTCGWRACGGRIQAVRIVRNPDKLRHVTPGTAIPSDLT